MTVDELLVELKDHTHFEALSTMLREYMDTRQKARSVVHGLSNVRAARSSYKIRNPQTGLFRTKTGDWSKVGSAWSGLGFLKAHLAASHKLSPDWPEWQVVELAPQSLIGTRLGDIWSPKR